MKILYYVCFIKKLVNFEIRIDRLKEQNLFKVDFLIFIDDIFFCRIFDFLKFVFISVMYFI